MVHIIGQDYESKRNNIEFFMPDVSLREVALSTKESFLVIVAQALKIDADGLEFSISSDGKGQIVIITGEKAFPVVKISAGIFDRYRELLSTALNSVAGLKFKNTDTNKIYLVSGEFAELESGRNITLRFSKPVSEKDLYEPDDIDQKK